MLAPGLAWPLPDPVHLYGSAACAFTAELREALQWRRVTFTEFDVDADPDARTRMIELSGGRTVPVLVAAGRVVQVGVGGRGCIVGSG